MRVLKFGGAALADGPTFERSAGLVESHGGERPLVVVSAIAGVTALLGEAIEHAIRGESSWDRLRIRHRTLLHQLGLQSDLLDRHLVELRTILGAIGSQRDATRRQRDFVLSFGERMSARLMAAVLRRRGRSATPLDAFDLGVVKGSDGASYARLAPPTQGLRSALAAVPGIPVVTGFVALDAEGHLTTLGPNGSDLTAVWFGVAAEAEEIVLWKDVPGVMSADPTRVPAARLLPRIGRTEAIELATHGASVLHPGALEPLRDGGPRLTVRSSQDPAAEGSGIVDETPHAGPVALAAHPSVARVVVPLELGRDPTDRLGELLDVMRATHVEPYRLEVSGASAQIVVVDDRQLGWLAHKLPAATLERGLASIAIVGAGVGTDAALDARLREDPVLLAAGAVPAPGGPGPASRAFLVPAESLDPLLRALHERYLQGSTVKPSLREWESAAE